MATIFLIVAGVMLGVAIVGWALDMDIAGLAILMAMLFGIVSCNRSDGYQAWERDRAAAQRAEEVANATPRVIREFDGCKMYAFMAGGKWQYVTRCANSVQTETRWKESCGKNKTCEYSNVTETR